MSRGRESARARAPRGGTRIKRGASTRTTRRQQRSGIAARLGAQLSRLMGRVPVSPVLVRRFTTTASLGLFAVFGWTVASFTGMTAWAHDEFSNAVARAGFQVEKVEVVGADRIDRLQVYDIVLRERSRSMAAVDLTELRRDLLSYGWVADARVSRRLPDTLFVELVEREPVAVWQHRGRLTLIDETGRTLDRVPVEEAGDLPVIIGAGANRRMHDLQLLLAAAPALRPQVVGATWVGNRRWDLRFRTGELLSLPEGDEASMAAFETFARVDGVNRVLGRNIVRVDMRNPDNMVLRPAPEGAVDGRNAGDNMPAPTAGASRDDRQVG